MGREVALGNSGKVERGCCPWLPSRTSRQLLGRPQSVRFSTALRPPGRRRQCRPATT